MSPCRAGDNERQRRFPRVSGDEPTKNDALQSGLTFSPRERG